MGNRLGWVLAISDQWDCGGDADEVFCSEVPGVVDGFWKVGRRVSLCGVFGGIKLWARAIGFVLVFCLITFDDPVEVDESLFRRYDH